MHVAWNLLIKVALITDEISDCVWLLLQSVLITEMLQRKCQPFRNNRGMLAYGFWLRKGILSVLMAAKPHREYDSCRASIVTECCLCTALKYHGLDQTPMAIIRYCGSEPKVNQCLNNLFSCWIAKASFSPSVHFIWSASKTSNPLCSAAPFFSQVHQSLHSSQTPYEVGKLA